MTRTRKPLLCLDTNASIDIGVVVNLQNKGESLDGQRRKINESWENVFYDEAKKVKDRHKQLSGTERFLCLVLPQSRICLPEFVKIEHARVRSDADSIPPFPVKKLSLDVYETSMEIFLNTDLNLQDSLVLASAIEMRADVLVTNDRDFKNAFNFKMGSKENKENAGLLALKHTGKPLLILDHRMSIPDEDDKGTEAKQPHIFHSLVRQSLLRHYGSSSNHPLHPYHQSHPRLGKPLWVGRRGDKGGWYLAYRQPLPPEGNDWEPYLVPGRDCVSIIDDHSWTVCEVRSVYFFDEGYPEGITHRAIKRTRKNYSDDPRVGRRFRPPVADRPGHIDVSIALDGFPPSWKGWSPSAGGRAGSKRNAPGSAVGFIETTVE